MGYITWGYYMKVIKKMPDKKINGKQRKMVLVECTKCGKQKEVRADVKQTTDYCRGCSSKTHGMTKSRLYNIWSNMKSRCNNPTNNRYQYYGGKGITVCDAWLNSFESFAEWANTNGYSEALSIDRINVNGNYEPSNCRWADSFTQAVNKQTKPGKSGFIGVTARYIVQIRQENEIIYSTDADSIEQAAYLREIFIIKNELPHQRNFPELSLEEIQQAIESL